MNLPIPQPSQNIVPLHIEEGSSDADDEQVIQDEDSGLPQVVASFEGREVNASEAIWMMRESQCRGFEKKKGHFRKFDTILVQQHSDRIWS